MMRLLNRHFSWMVARHRKMFLRCLHQIEEEANDDDHETSDQVTTELRRSTRVHFAPEWYGNPALEVMLLDNGKPTNYEEGMMSPDSDK